MIRRILPWATAATLVLGSTNALALESGFYLGAIGGQATIDVDESLYRVPSSTNFSGSFDDTDTALGIVAGGQFGRWFAVETQIMSLGEYTARTSQTLPNYFATVPRNLDIRDSSSVEAAAVTLSGILTIPIGEQVAIGLRLGFAATAAETSYEYQERRGNNTIYSESGDNDAEASDVSATFGVSVEWDPTPHFGMRLEYQRVNDVGSEDDDYDYDFEDDDDFDDEPEHGGDDIDIISLSLIGRF